MLLKRDSMIKRMHLKKRYYIALIILVIILSITNYYHNYQIKYVTNQFKIMEEYNWSKKEYYFNFQNDELTFDYYVPAKKKLTKHLVQTITVYNEDNDTCLIPQIKDLKSIPLCYEDNEVIEYHLVNAKMQEDLASFYLDNNSTSKMHDNITINNLVNHAYLVWNYQNFIYLNNDESKEIKLFKNDHYAIPLATVFNNHLVIPNYDMEYNFNQLYLLNLTNLKISTWDIPYDISFESYILGAYNKSIFLVDTKNKIEYELVPQRQKIRIVGTISHDGIIYDNGYQNISLNKLTQNKLNFNYNYSQNYLIKDNQLYLETPNNFLKIATSKVNKIIFSNGYEVYYLVNNSLYYYNVYTGNIKVMSAFEWNFNNDNIIFPINQNG
jgi:hypothetical protein